MTTRWGWGALLLAAWLAVSDAANASATNATANATSVTQDVSACGECCGGGSCSAAFFGNAGQCCGVLENEVPFCCPTDAECVRGVGAWACRRVATHKVSAGASLLWLLVFVILPIVACVCCVRSCMRSRQARPPPLPYAQPTPPVSYPQSYPPPAHGRVAAGYPTTYPTAPVHGAQQQYYNQPQQQQQGAGVSPWLAGGAGALGGMALGTMLADGFGNDGGGGGGGFETFSADTGGGGDFSAAS